MGGRGWVCACVYVAGGDGDRGMDDGWDEMGWSKKVGQNCFICLAVVLNA